jgi:hypothetical protein
VRRCSMLRPRMGSHRSSPLATLKPATPRTANARTKGLGAASVAYAD